MNENSVDFDLSPEETINTHQFPLWDKMRKDVRSLAVNFDKSSVKELVSTYYRIQEDRIALAAQARELQSAGSPHELVEYLSDQLNYMENSLKNPLKVFAESYPVGQWALSQYGIGPVITAGLIAHIDIEKASTAGSVWRYAGLDPTMKWEKGSKRPFNAELKVLSWKIGQSFMKFSGRDQCFYGKLYLQDKQRRVELNESGAYADRAKEILTTKNWKANKSSDTLKSGKLPAAQIDAQARRFAVKIFLSHFHTVWFETHFNRKAPTPYTIAHMDHVHQIDVPNYTPLS
jgi:hypothetical protein